MSVLTKSSESRSSVGPSTHTRRSVDKKYLWVWVGVVIIYVLMLMVTPNQASLRGISATLPYIGMLGIATIGQAFVIMQRGIDFSVVGIMLMAGMFVGTLTESGWHLLPAILATLLLGLVSGMLNGLIVVYLRITPLVATLASNGLFLSVALMLSNGAPVRMAQELHDFARSTFFGISWIFVISLIVLVFMAFLLSRSVWGRRFTAVGSNATSAWAAGLPVNRYVLTAYGIGGTFYAGAGILLAAYIGDSRTTSAGDYLMASISAVVIGGIPLTGGKGSLVAAFGGAIFMTLLTELVLGMGSPKAVQLMVQSIVLVTAVALPNLIEIVRRRAARNPTQDSKVKPAS